MKQIIYILIILSSFAISQAKFENKGSARVNNFGGEIQMNNTKLILETGAEVSNSGTISVHDRGDINDQAIGIESAGLINNENGYMNLKYYGSTSFNQNYLAGWVNYSSTTSNSRQFVPLIDYDTVSFDGTRKSLQKNNQQNINTLVARNRFDSKRVNFEFQSDEIKIASHKETQFAGNFKHVGITDKLSFIIGQNEDGLNQDSLNTYVNGDGQFQKLVINNNNDVDILEGGWSVDELVLRRGILKNTVENNFSVTFGGSIERYPESSLSIEPSFEGQTLVRYLGNGGMFNTGELPTEKDKLSDLEVLNNGGVTFTNDVFVSDRIVIDDNIQMNHDSNGDGEKDRESTLYYLNTDNTGMNFTNPIAEVIGNFGRLTDNIPLNESLTYNNIHTSIEFTENLPAVDTVVVRVEPNTEWDELEYGDDAIVKVKRKFTISAKNDEGEDITFLDGVNFGYGWRHDDGADPKAAYHETRDDNPDVEFDELGLERWDPVSREFVEETSTKPPFYDPINDWAYGVSAINGDMGEFAIGLAVSKYLQLLATAILEGPYDLNQEKMTSFLADSSLVPLTPQWGFYPFDYVSGEQQARDDSLYVDVPSLPDEAIDWILLEFRNEQENASQKFYKPAFIAEDGSILDTNGSRTITIWPNESGGIDISGTSDYYLAIHHRNHLPIVTSNTVRLTNKAESTENVDFTSFINVYQQTNALKVIGLDSEGNEIKGMVAGNVYRSDVDELGNQIDPNNYQIIEENDIESIYDFILQDTYKQYLRYDVNMDGIVNSKDLNMTWNNSVNNGTNGVNYTGFPK